MLHNQSQNCQVSFDHRALQKLAEIFKFAYCSKEPRNYAAASLPLGPPPADDQIVPLRIYPLRSFSCEEQLLLYDLFSGDICND